MLIWWCFWCGSGCGMIVIVVGNKLYCSCFVSFQRDEKVNIAWVQHEKKLENCGHLCFALLWWWSWRGTQQTNQLKLKIRTGLMRAVNKLTDWLTSRVTEHATEAQVSQITVYWNFKGSYSQVMVVLRWRRCGCGYYRKLGFSYFTRFLYVVIASG